MANFMDYLKNASNEMANIARQQQADQARAQLEAVRQAQREEAERQRAEREAEAARKRAEQEAKVRKAQAEADAKRAEAEAKAMKNIKDKASTVKNWLTSEDYNKSVGGVASDIAKQVGTGINNAAKGITVDAPAVLTDVLSTNLKNNLQRNYVGAIDEFGQAQYDEVMNPNYTPVKNTNYGDIFRNNPLADLYGAVDESLENDLRGTRLGGFTEGVAQQIPNAIAGNIAGPAASLGLMGVNVFGSSGQEALDQGYNPNQAAMYGLANAAVELGTEAINPGIPGVNMDAGLMPLVGEGLEEFIGGVADPYTRMALGESNIVDATQEAFSKENLKSALEQGVSGALSAGVMNAGQMMLTNPQGVADRVTGNNDYKRAINDINSQLEIAEQAVALNPNDVDAQMQRDNLLASRTMAQRTFATPENLNSDDSVTRNAARQANMDIIEDTARTSGAKLSPSEVRNIASIANKVGARVEFTSEPINGTDGFQDANGVLQINANAKDPVMTIFAHELTHATQGSRQYQQLHDTLVDMAKSGEISVDKLDGLASNPNLTEQQKYDETVATLAQEVFGNSDAIQNLANRNGSLIDRAIQTAKDFMSGNNSVTKAERAMQRAIKNADTRNLTSSNAYTRGEFPFADAVGETINVKDIGEHQSKLPYAVQEMANKLLKTNGSEEAVAKVLKKNGSQTPNYPDSAEYKRLMPQITEFIQSAKGRGVDSIKYENGQFVEVLKEKKSNKNKAEPVTEKTAEQKEAEKKARIEKFLKEQEALEKARTSKETKPAFNFDAAVAKAKEQGKFKDLGEAHTVLDVDTSLSKEAQKSKEKEDRAIAKEQAAKRKEEEAEKKAEEKAEKKGQKEDINILKNQFQYIYGLNNNGKTYRKKDLTANTVMDKINKQLEKAGMTYEELQERMMREAMGSKVAEVDANDPWAEQLENAKEELRFLKEKYNADILDEEINEFTDIDDAIDEIEFLREDSGADKLSPDEYDKLFEEYKNAKFPNRTSANEETAVLTEEEPASAEEQKETKIPDEQSLYDTLIVPGVQETLRMSLGGPRQDTRSISDSDNAALQAAFNQINDNVNAGDLYPTNAPLEAIYGQDAVKDSIFGPRNMSIEDPAVQQALMNTLPSANETVTSEVAEPATETVAPIEQVEESEPISVNDYVTDGDSIAEVIDMEDGQLTLRYENGVTETVDDNGLWNKTEAPQKAEPPVADKPNAEPSPVQEKPVEAEPPVVEKTKDGEVKVNEESITKESENITSENPEVKQQAKEDVKEAVKATIDPKNTHSEAVAQEVADTLEQASTAVNEVNQQWEEDVKKATVTTGEKGITKEKTVSKVMPKEAAEEYELKKEAGGPIAEYEKVSKIEYIRAGEKALEGKDLRACAQAYIDTPTNRNSVAATQQQATGLAIATHLGMEYENIKKANNIKVNKKGQYTINGKELSKDSPVYKQLADLDLTIQQVMAKERSVITNAAQAMAMQRWMTAQDPVQKANSIDKAIDMLNAEIKKKFGNDTDKLIKNLSQEERTRLAEASNEEYDKVLEEIMKRVGEAIPLTWKDRRRSWRYTMMLFNPTTIIRNWGGNVLQQGMHTGKNQIAYLLEKALADKYHLTEEQRHHTRADGTKARKNAQTEAIARAYYKNMGIKKLTQSKYLSKSGILNYKRSFNNGILQGMSDVVDWAMNNDKFGDEAFTSGRFVDELARQIDAEGYKVDKDGKTLVKDGKKLDSFDQEEALRRMSTRAYQQALESTYHDFNSFAQWLNTLEDSNKIAGIMVGGVVPFKSTPLNIMRRIGEYSPVGLANAVINNRSEVIKGNMSADTYIDNLAKGLTGTAIMGVGALLSSLGYLKASDKDPDELKAYKQDIGLTSEYALHFTDENGKNYWYTVDWAGPVASVMLSGAEAYEVISDIKKNADSGQDIFGDDALASALDITFGLLAPVFATTMLQNVEETFESYKYGGMTNTLEQMLLNYLGQYTPTIGAKINNVLDETKRSASGRTPIERFWRGQVKKIPTLDTIYNKVKGEHLLEPSINVKGEEEKNVGKTTFARAMYNFLSPGNYSEDTSTEADRELINLYAQTGDSNVLPESYSNFKLNDTQYKFTAKERTEMNKYIGQNYMKEWEAFQNSGTYKAAGNDAEGRDYKTDITEKLKTHAINNAKEKYFNRIGMSVLSDRDKIVNRMKDYGADNWQAYTMLSTQSDKDSTGKTINNSKALKIRAQMENAGIYDKVIKDINAGKYEPSDFGLNKTVIGLDAASFAERYMYLDQIENDSDVEAFNSLFKKKRTSGKSNGSSSKSAKSEADAALKLYEKIMKGEISATKSAISKVVSSLDKLDAESYDEIMNKHKRMMNELELYGM